MKPARKKVLHDQQRAEIKAVAWKQMNASGAASLSLGAIAREMDITTPALYRYFPSRDDLVSALIEDAYEWFAGALEQAREVVDPHDHVGRFRALCYAYRQWALDHPQPFNLLFGNPLPVYSMSAKASQLADHSFAILLEVVHAAMQAGKLAGPSQALLITPGLEDQLKRVGAVDMAYPAAALYIALAAWSAIHGLVSLELQKQFSILLADQAGEFNRLEVNRLIQNLGFSSFE